MTRTLIALAALLILAACVAPGTPTAVAPAALDGAAVARAKSALRRGLTDPRSAQFDGIATFRAANGDEIVCTRMNAKNRFGGYVGFQTAYVRLREDAVQRVLIDIPDGLIHNGSRACSTVLTGTVPLPP